MIPYETIDIQSITVVERARRPVDPDHVAALVDSIERLGLLQPIVLDQDRRLIAGLHRLRACEQLGWHKVPCVIRSYKSEEWQPFADSLDAEARLLPEEADAKLAEIDENLVRSELTTLEKAEYIALRKRIYEVRFPATRKGGNKNVQKGRETVEGELYPNGHDGRLEETTEEPFREPFFDREGAGAPKTVEGGLYPNRHHGGLEETTEEPFSAPPFSTHTAAATGMSERTVQRLARIGEMPEEVRAELRGTPAENSVTALEAIAKRPHVARSTGEVEWYTPPHIIEAARNAMGGICMDPATSLVAQRFVEADNYYTKEEDGLQQPWWGSVWLNPPYARGLIDKFVARLIENWQHEDFYQACVLVNNATETTWFHQLAETASAVCFIKGRLKFLDETGKPARAPLQGQVVFYVGHSPDRFAEAFDGLGLVVRL